MLNRLLAPLLAALACARCSTESIPTPSFTESSTCNASQGAGGPSHLALDGAPLVTYASDIGPLISSHCVVCHGTDGQAPELTSYDDVFAVADKVVSVVTSSEMPLNNPLASSDQQTFATWMQDGYRQDATDAPHTLVTTSIATGASSDGAGASSDGVGTSTAMSVSSDSGTITSCATGARRG